MQPLNTSVQVLTHGTHSSRMSQQLQEDESHGSEEREECQSSMRTDLLPLPAGQLMLYETLVPVASVYLPRPSDNKHRVQWPVSAPAPASTATRADHSHTTQTTYSAAATTNSSNELPVVLSEPVSSILCSKDSQHDQNVLYLNNSPYTVRLMWVSFQGEEVAYDELQPGEQLLVVGGSFAMHTWIAREASTATQLPINMQEAFCVKLPAAVPHPDLVQVPVAAAAAAAEAAGQADALTAMLGLAAQDVQNAAQQLQQGHEHVGEHQAVQEPGVPGGNEGALNGPGIVLPNFLCAQRAEITGLPALPWSESAHPHFPPAFKAAVRTFLLCHLQLQQAMHAEGKLQPWLPAAADSSKHAVQMQVTAVQGQPCAGRCSRSSHLGCMPDALLPHIVRLAAPYAPQHMELPLSLRPDILPTCLAEEPDAPAVDGDDDLPNEDG